MVTPGFRKKLLISNDPPITWAELPATSANMSLGADMLDDTTYLSTGWKARLAGLRDFSCSGDLIYDTTVTAFQVLNTALLSGNSIRFKYLLTDQDGITGTFFVEKFDISGDVSSIDKVSFSLQATGSPLTILTDLGSDAYDIPRSIFKPSIISSIMGQVVSYTPGSWTYSPTVIHALTLDGISISDGYVLQVGDVGKSLVVTETAVYPTATFVQVSNPVIVMALQPIAVASVFKTGDTAYGNDLTVRSSTSWVFADSWTIYNTTGKALNNFKIGMAYIKNASSSNAVREILIDTGGSGYTFANAAVSGGSGSGCVLGCVVSSGQVTAIYILNTGSGWKVGEIPIITITGDGTGATAHITLMDGDGEAAYRYNSVLSAASVTYNGTQTNATWGGSASANMLHGNILQSDTITLPVAVPPGGSALIKITETIAKTPILTTTVVGGGITGWSITDGGSGLWANSYALKTVSGTGSGATATAYTYQGKVVYIVPGNPGTGYGASPSTYMTNNIERPIPSYNSGSVGSGPAWVTAYAATYAPGGVIIGDSIANGFSGGDSVGDYLAGYGFLSRIFGPAGIGIIKLTLPGDYMSSFNDNHTARMQIIADTTGTNFGICEYGVNDISRGDSLATLQANWIAGWSTLKMAVGRVWQTTITPRTTSTNGWVDLANQTAASAAYAPGGVRDQAVAWLRDGAPIINGVAASPGTTNPSAIRAGSAGHPLVGICDTSRIVESPIDSTKWRPLAYPGVAVSSGATADGTHPYIIYHAMIRGCVGTVSGNGGTGFISAPSITWTNLGVPVMSATISGGVVTGLTVLNDGGVTYLQAPVITVLGINGAGSGAKFNGVLTAGRLSGATQVAGGTNYTNGALVAVDGGLPPQAHAVVNPDTSISVVLDWPGSNLTSVPNVVVGGDGGGSGASFTATLAKGIDTSVF